MPSFFMRQGVKFAAAIACTASLAACGGGGTSGPAAPVQLPAAAPASALGIAAPARFALGFVPADPATIATLSRIRHDLSLTPIPATGSVAAKMPPVGYQGSEGSCASWASAYALRGYEARRDVWAGIPAGDADPAYNFSPSFVYNQVNGGQDNGSTIPAVLTLLQKTGAATLADMPYIAGQYRTQPSAAALADAAHYKLSAFGYIAPTDLSSMKAQIATGIPVVLAIKVYNNFFSLAPNTIYTATGGGYAGGHAVTAVAYDDTKQAIEIMNSWGTSWATGGFAWISYSALSQIAVEAYSAIDDHGIPSAPTPTPAPTVKPAPTPTVKPTPAPVPTVKPTPAPPAKPGSTPTPAPKAAATAAPKH